MDFSGLGWFFSSSGRQPEVSTKEVDTLFTKARRCVVCSAAAWDIPRRILVLLSSGSLYNDYLYMCMSHFTLSSDVM